MTTMLFQEMNLSAQMAKAIRRMGFETATEIQAQAIPVIREGGDVIARSRTGTGKTVAFGIPALERVDTHNKQVQVLVLCPTRELAVQAAQELERLAQYQPELEIAAIYGGARMDKQCIALRHAHVVVGTPGRIMDHMRRKSLKLDGLKMVVLDEADEMLNMGFKEDMEAILSQTPESRQTVLFSATMPKAILQIAHQFQKEPVTIQAQKDQLHDKSSIAQHFLAVPHRQKKAALLLLLQYYNPGRSIVFSGTKKMADELCQELSEQGFLVDCLHSDIKQEQRMKVMQGFRNGKTKILVATDIAARGIDVQDVECVFNFDLPQNKEHYIHRIGRTGRAGKSGISVTICTNRQQVAELQRMSANQAQEMQVPTQEQMEQKVADKISCTLESVLDGAVAPVFGLVVKELRAKGYSAEQIAQAALALHYGQSVQPVTKVTTLGQKNSQRQEGYQAIELDVGRMHRVSVNHLVGAITQYAGLETKQVGRIEILPEMSLVEVPAEQLDHVVSSMQGCKIAGRKVYAVPSDRRPALKEQQAFANKGKRVQKFGKNRSGADKQRRHGRQKR